MAAQKPWINSGRYGFKSGDSRAKPLQFLRNVLFECCKNTPALKYRLFDNDHPAPDLFSFTGITNYDLGIQHGNFRYTGTKIIL